MKIELVKFFDGRTVEEVFSGKPMTVKAEFVDDRGITYFGWVSGLPNFILFPDWGEENFDEPVKDFEHRFFQSSLATGKKCQRKVSEKIQEKLLQLITDHAALFKITDWYYWKK